MLRGESAQDCSFPGHATVGAKTGIVLGKWQGAEHLRAESCEDFGRSHVLATMCLKHYRITWGLCQNADSHPIGLG